MPIVHPFKLLLSEDGVTVVDRTVISRAFVGQVLFSEKRKTI